MTKYILSVDLGKEADFTAFSILEVGSVGKKVKNLDDIRLGRPGRTEIDYIAKIVFLERPDVGTPYGTIVDRTVELMRTPPLAGETTLVVDITGVGVAVVDWMVREGLHPLPINIHGGREVQEHPSGGYGVPKVDLGQAVETLFGQHRLKYAAGLGLPKEDLTEAWYAEMKKFSAKISQKGNVTFEAWRSADHDDLVLSVAMGAWLFLREHPYRHIYYADEAEKPYDPKRFK